MDLGFLIYNENKKELYFITRSGKLIKKDYINKLEDYYNHNEGIFNIPKPAIMNDKGEILEKGDLCLYELVDEQIIILGSVKPLYYDSYEKDININLNEFDNLLKKVIILNNQNRYLNILDNAKNEINIYYLHKNNDTNKKIRIRFKSNNFENRGDFIFETDALVKLSQINKDKEIVNEIELINNEDDGENIVIKNKDNKILLDKDGITITDKNNNIIELKEGGVEMKVDKIIIGNDIKLKDILLNLIKAIKVMTLATPTGNTIAPPINVNDFIELENKIKNFMEL